MMYFEAVKNKKIIVYEKLREEIIKCEILPGTPINEANLANYFDVSKTPVREAIRQLERDGLVNSIPGRGSIIADITSDDIYETFYIREVIECAAAKRVASLQNKDVLIKKREEIQMLKKHNDENKETTRNWDFCDDVHLFIVKLVGNKKLLSMYEDILADIERIRNYFSNRFSGRRFDNILDEHLEILDSIIKGDAAEAQERVESHLKNAYMYINSLR